MQPQVFKVKSDKGKGHFHFGLFWAVKGLIAGYNVILSKFITFRNNHIVKKPIIRRNELFELLTDPNNCERTENFK